MLGPKEQARDKSPEGTQTRDAEWPDRREGSREALVEGVKVVSADAELTGRTLVTPPLTFVGRRL